MKNIIPILLDKFNRTEDLDNSIKVGSGIMLFKFKDNPALLRSNVSIGDTARITSWHPNLLTGMAFIYKLGIEMPVTSENFI